MPQTASFSSSSRVWTPSPTSDFWARSSKGPWHIAVNEDCMLQFKARYGEHTTIKVHNVDVKVKIKIDSIEDKLNKKGSSSRQALYEALQDVAAHVVIEGRRG